VRVTFYGHFSGYSSYPTVCRAIASTLDGVGKDITLCDLRPETHYDGVKHIPQVQATDWMDVQLRARLGVRYADRGQEGMGLTFGFPEWARCVPRHEVNVGYHVCDLNQIPPSWVEDMNRLDHVLTPSEWCRSVFLRCGVKAPITVVPHGVASVAIDRSPEGPFTFLHFCSAAVPGRKGTLELVEAFHRTSLDARLAIYTESPVVLSSVRALKDDRVIAGEQPFLGVWAQYERYRTAHVVVQPSRAEGFGMIPLEALSVGTPAIATDGTGHAMFVLEEPPGLVPIPTGDLAPCPPGPGLAPRVRFEDIGTSLLYAYDKYDTLRKAAQENRAAIQARWSWEKVLQPLADMIG